jgi:hypothetical protein
MFEMTCSLSVIIASTNDINEGIFKRCSTNQKAVNVRLCDELFSILICNTSSVKNTCLISSFSRNIFLQPFTNDCVSSLSLFRGCNNTSSDCPNGFISNYDFAPVFNMLSDSSKLSSVNSIGVARFSFIKLFSNASHDAQTVIKSVQSF